MSAAPQADLLSSTPEIDHEEGSGNVSGTIFALVENVAAIFIAFDTALLLVGVIARYVFHRPIIWSDELAVTLLVWISMLGAGIAARRNGHMRLTAFVDRLPGSMKRRANAFAGVICIVSLACLVLPSVMLVHDHWAIRTAALGITEAIRLSAIPTGLLLMLIGVLPRYLATTRIADTVTAVVALLIVAGLLWASRGVLADLENWALVVFFVVGVFGSVLVGVPIAFAFGLATLAYLQFMTTTPLTVVAERVNGGIAELLLLSIPIFIVLGLLLEITGMARTLIGFLVAIVGHVRGGLNYVLLGAMFLISGISGSKAADMAAVAPMLMPEMKRRGYDEGELVALFAVSGGMSETIPPSLVLIALGSVAGISVAALFTAGLLPALLGSFLIGLVVFLKSRRSTEVRLEKAGLKEIVRTGIKALPVLALPVLIRVLVVEGVATATEVATIAVVYTLVVGLLMRAKLGWRQLKSVLVESANLTGVVLLILGMATAMAWALTQSGFAESLAVWIGQFPGGRIGFLIASIVMFAVLGSLLEGLPALIVLGPLLFPAAELIGINQIHYAMVVIFAMSIGLFAPPFGVGYYMACIVSRISPDAGMKKIVPYLAALLLATVLLAVVPAISTVFIQ